MAYLMLSDVFDFIVTMGLFILGWSLFRMFRTRMEHAQWKAAEATQHGKNILPREVTSGAASASSGDAIASGIVDTVSSAHARLQQLTQVMGEDASCFSDDETCFAAGVTKRLSSMSEAVTQCPSDGSECWGPPCFVEDDDSDGVSSDGLVSSIEGCRSGQGFQEDDSEASSVEKSMMDALNAAIDLRDSDSAHSVLLASASHCGLSWMPKACRLLVAAGMPLNCQRAVELVEHCRSEGRTDVAVDLWLERPCGGPDSAAGFEVDEVYDLVLKACVESCDFESAARAARNVGWRAPPSKDGQQALLVLSRWLVRRNALGPALACYDAARRSGTTVDVQTHRALLKACASNGDMMRADILFQEFTSAGLPLDVATFSSMIRGHRAAGNSREAMSYFEEMRRRGIQPDASLHDAVFDSRLWHDVPALLERVLADMEAADVKPSNGTLATVLRLYGQSNRIDRALEVFEELPRRHGFQVDSRSYSAMIAACLRNGRVDLALETFDRMVVAGFTGKAKLNTFLVNACAKRGDLNGAVRVVDKACGLQRHAAAPALCETEPAAELEPQSPSTCRLEPRCIANLLRAIWQRGEVARLGAPLVERLRSAGLDVPPAYAAAVLKEDAEVAAEDDRPLSVEVMRQARLRRRSSRESLA
eukprot:TRINITY_DN31306_c0_g1_i1.p1 TRINITY_DN31306_c0_g1~~TRINITY_DN31306_c0_g1_i1.p1  ORF type:complete len:690 (+),score=127.31 TRINITY_DN31306_c0_g1_i1:124-2070(+)